jgi:hypothetical protein
MLNPISEVWNDTVVILLKAFILRVLLLHLIGEHLTYDIN